MADECGPTPQQHGGNPRGVVGEERATGVLDFSASINPLGCPKQVRQAVIKAWGSVEHYPDPYNSSFVDVVSDVYGLERQHVLAGNGSAELFDLGMRGLSPRRVMVCPPDFGLYYSLKPAGVELVEVPRLQEKGFAVDVERVCDALTQGDLLFLSNPNNPSGCGLDPVDVEKIAFCCETVGATLALDEAFADFAPELSLLGSAEPSESLLIFRSLTKYYSIAGLRLGFVWGGAGAIGRLRGLQVFWSVNALASVAGRVALELDGWDVATSEMVNSERDRLTETLGAHDGVTVLPSRANYLLVELSSPAPSATELFEGLLKRDLLVRHCASFGLGDKFLRVAVRTPAENARLIDGWGTVMRLAKG